MVQVQIQKLAAAIGRGFFRDWRPADPASLTQPSQTQSQSQSQGPAEATA
jgi:hypothetical protein